MEQKNSLFNRVLSLFLVVCMLVALPQVVTSEVFAAEEFSKTSDPSTMDSWKKFFGSNVKNTENAGTVWTDKSVFTSASPFRDYGIGIDDPNGFLTALSVMASTKEVTGYTNVPTDTMLILDLSSSMYDNGQGYRTVETMANAVNAAMRDLQAINVNNRVGVCIYFGGPNVWDMPDINVGGIVFLTLGRYKQAQNKFFDITANGDKLYSFKIADGVTNENGVVMQGAHYVPEIAGTYTQWGLLDALEHFLGADTKVPMDSPYQPGVSRLPVFVLMTDGVPTAARSDFYQKGPFELGHNSVADRHPAQTDFLTQLTAAYVKEKVDMHYKDTTPLFYTLSLGNAISEDITNPSRDYDARCDAILANPGNYSAEAIAKAEVNDVIRDHWYSMIKDGGFLFRIQRYVQGTYNKAEVDIDGSRIDIGSDKGLFPWSEDQRYYVDQAFSAAQANNLASAFGTIVEQIGVQSKYLPTLVEGDEDEDGYISFIDNIGKYMQVSDVKGITLGDRFFSGAELAYNVRTYLNTSSSFERDLIEAVKIRLGITSNYVADDLIDKAYNAGQLKYTNSSNYSNYIGWFASSSGKYLGFWDGTESGKNNYAGAAYVVKSYGYLGYVDDSQGVVASDMMYAVVQVKENIATGEQTVEFSVPASLVPMVTYEIGLDKYDGLEKFAITGATEPMRLIYEVVLDSSIDGSTVIDGKTVDSEYLKKNTNADGSVNFYTNEYERDNSLGYGKVNAYSNFKPSHENETYYFQEDKVIYSNNNGRYTEYSGYSAPSKYSEYYYAEKVYYGSPSLRIGYVYKKLSAEAIETAKSSGNGKWYIPAGTVHVNLENQTEYKTSNPTNTLKTSSGRGIATMPFVDIEGHGLNDIGHHYVVGATLGNNGRITVYPSAAIKITKTVEGVQGGNDEFSFRITSTNETSGTYSAVKTAANGTETKTSISFFRGTATVSLKNGESILITGLSGGNTYRITESETVDYVLKSINGNVSATEAVIITEAGAVSQVDFVNAPVVKGDLRVTKVVEHTLGDGYQLTHNRSFEINITLTGEDVQNTTFRAKHSADASITQLTTNSQGKFPVISLKNGETIEIFDIPASVVATVVETNAPQGFVPSYRENGVSGDGVVTIYDGTASVDVVNTYSVEGSDTVVIKGTKELIGKNLEDGMFIFLLKDESGAVVDSKENENGKFEFSLDFTEADLGRHVYTVTEERGNLAGVAYDASVYTLTVNVEDNGNGGITVTSELTKEGKAVASADFVNTYTVTGKDTVVIKGTKELVGKALEDGMFTFVLKDESGAVVDSKENENGKFEFSLDFTEADLGRHVYTVTEERGNLAGVTYDDSVYTLTVNVEDNGNGGITVTSELTKEGKAVTSADFVNTYTVTGKDTVVIKGTKELVGKALEDGMFTFVLKDESGAVVDSKKNENGKFEFSLEFTEENLGRHVYTVVETNEGKGGITYDASVYTLTVNVEDNGKGGITVTSELTKEGKAVESADFVNTYTVTGKDTVVIKGTKELIGKNLEDGMFTFVLKDVNGKIIETKTNKDGKFEFSLEFTEENLGRHVYTVVETNEGKGGITYDASVYTLTVNVEDNGNGGITVTSELTKEGKAVESADFVNTYTVTGKDTVVIKGTKELIGKDLEDGMFTFVLKDVNGKVIATKTNKDGKFEFSLEFTEENLGRHVYTVVETNEGKGGIKYDESIYTLTVNVEDNGNGGITVTSEFTKEGKAVESADFVNTYSVTGKDTVVIKGTKELVGKALEDGMFTFVLKDESGAVVDSKKNENGKFEFSLEFTEENLGRHVYTVVETNEGKGGITYDASVYTLTVNVVDNGNGGITVTSELTKEGKAVESADFVNTYSVTGKDTVVIKGTKELIGKDLEDYMFTFVLKDANGKVIATKTNENGKFEFSLDFTEENLGRHVYTVVETNEGKGGITYDASVYTLTVNVEDNGKGGITVTSELTKEGKAVESADFVNTYTATGKDTVVIKGTKELVGKTLEDGMFTFALKDANGKVIETKTNENGKFEFSLEFTEENIGTHTYTVVELNDGKGGITYDASVYTVTVNVEDNGNGGITVDSTITKGGNNTEKTSFTNYYNVSGREIVVIKGTKELVGKTLEDNMFTFVLKDANGKQIATKKNVAGAFEFVLEYTEADAGKTYAYTVTETNEGEGGITYDASVYTLTVNVEDNGNGGITVTSELTKEGKAVESADFVNTYASAGKDTVVIKGTKELIGKDLEDGMFTFALKDANGNVIETKTNENGKFEFSLEFTEENLGRHVYTVVETNEGKGGITYDASVYTLIVNVEDNGNGGITVTSELTKEGKVVTSADFVNTYTATGSDTVVIKGTKELIGKDLENGMFTFALKDANGKVIATKTNENGKFEFSLDFTEENIGTHTYTVVELNEGKGGITYDASVYTLTVNVEDNGKGGITVTSELTKEGKAVTSADFVNTYSVTGSDTVVIKGTKELVGKDLEDNTFTFALKDFAGVVIDTKQNADGKFQFELKYTGEDAGKVFEYQLVEVNGEMDRVEYDTSIYTIKVTVSDNGKGGIIVESQITKGEEAVTECAFVNVYTPKPDDLAVEIIVDKTVQNIGTEEIGPDGFEFVLENVTLSEKHFAVSDVDGKATFNLVFSESDIGKTYSYKVYEVNDGRENVEYSTVVYDVTISITLGDDNKLYATVIKGEETVDKAVCEFENIYNETPPAKPGDSAKTVLWTIALGISAFGFAATMYYGKRKKEEQDA